MAICELCGNQSYEKGVCLCCGKTYYTATVTFIYGQTEKDSQRSEIRITDKYLVARVVTNKEVIGGIAAAATGGVVGAITAGAVNSARRKDYGFYDLQDFQKVIYPYKTKSLKGETAFKFVNMDGSSFILNCDQNGMFCKRIARKFAESLASVGITIENGDGARHPYCCEKPFVDKTTFSAHICKSAAAFVKMSDKQFVADEVEHINHPQSVSQEPIEETILPETAPIEEEKPEEIICSSCGAANPAIARFCSECGNAFEEIVSPEIAPIE